VFQRLITHTYNAPLATPSYPYLPMPLLLPTLLLLPSTPTYNPTYPPTPNQAGAVDLARIARVRGVLEACVLDVLRCGMRCVLLRSPKHGTRHRRLRAARAHLTRQVLRYASGLELHTHTRALTLTTPNRAPDPNPKKPQPTTACRAVAGRRCSRRSASATPRSPTDAGCAALAAAHDSGALPALEDLKLIGTLAIAAAKTAVRAARDGLRAW
jgi:hypothetical protein